MKYIAAPIRSLKQLSTRYPAVLSGYIIYAYLFVAMIRLFLKVKYGGATLSDAYDIFSALPFMWLLAVALVKVIEIRSKLHASQTERMRHEEQLRLKETQLRTMKEVVRGMQHHINNPLAILVLYLTKLKQKFAQDRVTLDDLEKIGIASTRISKALADYTVAQEYQVDFVEYGVGNVAMPPKVRKIQSEASIMCNA